MNDSNSVTEPTIEPQTERPHKIGDGIQKLYRFDNGYGASVVQFSVGFAGSYGAEAGLWELAVIRWNSEDNYGITYDTPITDDVIGYLSDDEVQGYLRQIRDLPAAAS